MAALQSGGLENTAQGISVRHRKYRVECDLFLSHRHEFDPLNREILERAFDGTLEVVQGNSPSIVNLGGNDGPKAIIRRELIEIAHYPARHPLDSSVAGLNRALLWG